MDTYFKWWKHIWFDVAETQPGTYVIICARAVVLKLEERN